MISEWENQGQKKVRRWGVWAIVWLGGLGGWVVGSVGRWVQGLPAKLLVLVGALARGGRRGRDGGVRSVGRLKNPTGFPREGRGDGTPP